MFDMQTAQQLYKFKSFWLNWLSNQISNQHVQIWFEFNSNSNFSFNIWIWFDQISNSMLKCEFDLKMTSYTNYNKKNSINKKLLINALSFCIIFS